ncbi:hypothetical protein [Streptomyces aureocirculatus]|uniref:hypothetical protein n=1 Tax=Streptomyces aureocirculatus TaxID=67275 RepID=UPI001331B9AC|nr:hypothetical protein [Streptomyces aureocirculatus]
MKRQLGIVGAVLVLAAGSIGMAPEHTRDPNGCGKTDRGWLCMGSPAGGHRPGVYKSSYARHQGAEITVKLGYEIKMKRTGVIAESKWLGTKKTRNGYAAFSKRLPMGDDACIRAKMRHNGKKYISKYLSC